MNTWKMVSGLVSMLAAAAVLTSVLTSYKNLGGTSAQPAGLIVLGLAALVLGLAGIVQVVFRDGLIERARIVTVALFALAAVLFLITAIIAFLDVNGWIQIITLIVWSIGCAAFAYVDYVWAYNISSDAHLSAQEEADDEEEIASREEVSTSEEADGEEPGDMPEIPDVDISAEPHEDSPVNADAELTWDGSGPPPRIS
ncbi:MAG: hypothetical protein IKS49_04680 [Actinomycetaceae bacterium]|nr:hypothetical protein [Actinomycetaceae bacterium]